MSEQSTAVAEPEVRPEKEQKSRQDRRPKRQPPYHVILWDDNEHTYDYVIRMMQELFGHTLEQSWLLACEVDTQGRVVCLTTTKEHAELKRDQIHAFGRDDLINRCKGSMSASIEPAE